MKELLRSRGIEGSEQSLRRRAGGMQHGPGRGREGGGERIDLSNAMACTLLNATSWFR
ncbi:hypothetical protein WJ66_00278 [Stenotrophomonas maltophilia WJ66]|nr:hypothetical protein WJ66_00278 [Stenotrophomonas maltophilia WJ66]